MRVTCSAVVVFVMVALFASKLPAQATIEAYIPSNTPAAGASNVIPFGTSTPFTPGYTYMAYVPASFFTPSHPRLEEISMSPIGSGVWSCPTILMGVGHLPTPVPCPFTFPGPGGATPGSFLDFTVIYDSATQGPFTWNVTQDTWSPMGFAPTGTNFIWNGVNDVGFYVTFQGSMGTPGTFSGGFHASATSPPSRTYAGGFQAISASGTACTDIAALIMRLTMGAGSGLFASFNATPLSGSAPLAVNFTDNTFSSDPGGVLTWAWDVNNDGIDDYFTQNPIHTYNCPGPYSVRLSVTDASHPSSQLVRMNFINVGNPALGMTTTGGGVGDMTLTPVPTTCFPSVTEGYTFITFAGTMTPVGTGPFFGISPDLLTISVIVSPAAPGNILHFVPSGTLYPNGGPVFVPPGFFSSLNGFSMDAVEVLLDASRRVVLASGVARVTF